MDLIIGESRNENYIVISLNSCGNSGYKLKSFIDDKIDYDVNLRCGELEAIECFKNLQIKYFDRIINEGNFKSCNT